MCVPAEIKEAGGALRHKDYFDTLKVTVADAEGVKKRAAEKQINLR